MKTATKNCNEKLQWKLQQKIATAVAMDFVIENSSRNYN